MLPWVCSVTNHKRSQNTVSFMCQVWVLTTFGRFFSLITTFRRHPLSTTGREIAPNTGDQILKIGRQIGD